MCLARAQVWAGPDQKGPGQRRVGAASEKDGGQGKRNCLEQHGARHTGLGGEQVSRSREGCIERLEAALPASATALPLYHALETRLALGAPYLCHFETCDDRRVHAPSSPALSLQPLCPFPQGSGLDRHTERLVMS